MNVSLSYTLALAVGATFTFTAHTAPGADPLLPDRGGVALASEPAVLHTGQHVQVGSAGHGARHAGGSVAGRCGSVLAGFVNVTRRDQTVKLFLNVLNAPPGEHAVRLHQVSDCSASDAASAGPVWGAQSSAPADEGPPGELGNLGNLSVDASGRGLLSVSVAGWALGSDSETDLVGRAVVIHERPGELLHDAGPDCRIGCAAISLAR